jgi:hypothetical protein
MEMVGKGMCLLRITFTESSLPYELKKKVEEKKDPQEAPKDSKMDYIVEKKISMFKPHINKPSISRNGTSPLITNIDPALSACFLIDQWKKVHTS